MNSFRPSFAFLTFRRKADHSPASKGSPCFDQCSDRTDEYQDDDIKSASSSDTATHVSRKSHQRPKHRHLLQTCRRKKVRFARKHIVHNDFYSDDEDEDDDIHDSENQKEEASKQVAQPGFVSQDEIQKVKDYIAAFRKSKQLFPEEWTKAQVSAATSEVTSIQHTLLDKPPIYFENLIEGRRLGLAGAELCSPTYRQLRSQHCKHVAVQLVQFYNSTVKQMTEKRNICLEEVENETRAYYQSLTTLDTHWGYALGKVDAISVEEKRSDGPMSTADYR